MNVYHDTFTLFVLMSSNVSHIIYGGISIQRFRLISIGIPVLKIRRFRDRLIFNMGIPIPEKDGFYIETGPCFLLLSAMRNSAAFPHVSQYVSDDSPLEVALYNLAPWSSEILEDCVVRCLSSGHCERLLFTQVPSNGRENCRLYIV